MLDNATSRISNFKVGWLLLVNIKIYRFIEGFALEMLIHLAYIVTRGRNACYGANLW